jgi:hypothetical protein
MRQILDFFMFGRFRNTQDSRLVMLVLFLVAVATAGIFHIFYWVFSEKSAAKGFMSQQTVLSRFIVVWLGFAAVGSLVLNTDLMIIITIITLMIGSIAILVAAHIAIYQVAFLPLAYFWQSRRTIGFLLSVFFGIIISVFPGYISQESARREAALLQTGDFIRPLERLPRTIELQGNDDRCDTDCIKILKLDQIDSVTVVTKPLRGKPAEERKTYRASKNGNCIRLYDSKTIPTWCVAEASPILESELVVSFDKAKWLGNNNEYVLFAKPDRLRSLLILANQKPVLRRTEVSYQTWTMPLSIFENKMTISDVDLIVILGELGYSIPREV